MPSKRQPSKQRRAAENRAKRQALAARSEHAAEPRPARPSTSTLSSGASGAKGSSRSTGLSAAGSGLAAWFGFGRGGGRPEPGARAALFAVMFGLAALVATPFIPVSVDDQGDQLPVRFGGLYLSARSHLTGEEVVSKSESLLSASGPSVLIYLAIPMLVILAAVVMFRRTGRSLPLTVGMLALAVLVMIAGSIYFMPSMIAMAVGSFQVRKVEMAARMADRAAADDTDDEPEEDDEYDEGEYDEEDEYEEAEYDGEEDEYDEDEAADEPAEDELVDEGDDSKPRK